MRVYLTKAIGTECLEWKLVFRDVWENAKLEEVYGQYSEIITFYSVWKIGQVDNVRNLSGLLPDALKPDMICRYSEISRRHRRH